MRGPSRHKQITHVVNANGVRWTYEGERWVRCEFSDGRAYVFAGKAGEERMVFMVYPDGQVDEYVGARGRERVSRVTFSDGLTLTYEGAPGRERAVGPGTRSDRSRL